MTIMPPLTVPGRLRPSARLAVTASVAAGALLFASCSSVPSGTDWKGQMKYGAYMAKRGFWREALFRFEKAVELQPDDAKVQNNLAVACESVGETARALSAYKRALELAPNDTQIKRNYARFAESYTAAQRASSPSAPPPK